MNKKIIYIVLIIVLGVMLFISGFALGLHIKMQEKQEDVVEEKKEEQKEENINSKNKYAKIDLKNLEYKAKDNTDLTKNIQIIDAYSYSDSEMVIYAKNNNNVPVTISSELNFLDAEGYIIEYTYGSTPTVIKANSDFYITVYLKYTEDYKTTNFEYSASKIKSIYEDINVTEKDIELMEEDITINALFKNKTGKDIMISGMCVYYNNNKVVGITPALFGGIIKNGDYNTAKCGKYKLKDTKYDKYEFKIVSAYYTSKEW